ELPVVRGDYALLVELFQNLVSNAIKHRGDYFPRISISSSIKSDEWEFAVKDNGPGIPSGRTDKIFQIFVRYGHSEEQGSGIGLSICKKIVECHGGRIWVTSEEGKGSTFFFTIPR
ncbi:MAG TPA: ATP-binding protein, partial [Spirochaetota bacterium]